MSLTQVPHEAIHNFEHDATGVRGLVAIHSTALGPAVGGCRIWHYDNEGDCVRDVLRLSEGMTYKNALAGLPFGGGKAVLMLGHHQVLGKEERRLLLSAFGEFIEKLEGRYITAEDVGSSPADMVAVASRTRFVAGLPIKNAAAGGDPSPWTALGVFLSMQAAARHRYGSDLAGMTVGVQGLGHVGMDLCSKLHGSGAHLLISDIDAEKCTKAAREFGAQIFSSSEMINRPMDIFAPCAMGGILDKNSVDALQATIVCGAANNQLATTDQGQQLSDRKILYAPDYLVNAGGIINVSAEYLGESTSSVEQRVRAIPDRLLRLVRKSEATGEPMNELADNAARAIVQQARAGKVA